MPRHIIIFVKIKMMILKNKLPKSAIEQKPIDLSLPDIEIIPFRQEFFKIFHQEFQIKLKESITIIDKRVRIAPSVSSFESDFETYSRIRYSLFYELIDEIGYSLFKILNENLVFAKYPKVSQKAKEYLHSYFIHNLNILTSRFLDIISNGARQMNADSTYENDTKIWLGASFQTKVNRLIEKLDIEINKFNYNPKSFIYRIRDQFYFEIIKYLLAGSLGYFLGRL